MTAQTPDILIHRNARLDLYATPLRSYLDRLPKARRPDFVAESTALWRSYVATWEILDGVLHLVDLEGVARTDDGIRDVDPAAALPWRRGPIPATWGSETLRCPEGRLCDYVHAGFASGYERDREFTVRRGVVEREALVCNAPPALVYEITPAGERIYRGERSYLPGPYGLVNAIDTREDREADPFPNDAPVEPWRLWGDPDPGLADVG